MNHHNDDQQIHDLFRAARRADQANAPGYDSVRRATSSRKRLWAQRGFRLAFSSVLGTVAIAATVLWVGTQQTPPVTRVVPDEPIATPESGSMDISGLGRGPTVGGNREAPPPTGPKPAGRDEGLGIAGKTGEVAADPRNEERREKLPVAQPPPPPALQPHVIDQLAESHVAFTAASAQSGGLTVKVNDVVGPFPGAIVTIGHETGFVKTTSVQTGVRGEAVFPVLRPGRGYVIEVSMPNFGTQRVSDIQVRINDMQTVPVVLAQEIVETVKVVAEGDVVRLEEAQQTTKFSAEFVQDIPLPGRFYQNVLTLAPGVLDADGDGNPNVHGSRDREFKTSVGGVSNVDPLTGQQMSHVNPNSIEEMEVISAGAGAEFSRALSNTESYAHLTENEFLAVEENPLSTFSIDVDTASYSNVRRYLNAGQLPPVGAVRIEELINYFNYDYPQPDGDAPFSATVEVSGCPWNTEHRLARIGLKGRQMLRGEFAGSNLVFLIDVSGSMRPANKLPLLKSALKLLVSQLDGRDQVAMVVYAGSSGLVLDSTSGADSTRIHEAIDRLRAGGSTNGGQGIRLAYKVARENFIPGGVNRVILATDGDFNVGVSSHDELLKLIKQDADNGIFLTALGFGGGNYKDDTLELLADKGNGNYAYIDNPREAQKVLVEEVGGTLVTIAKDVKIQIEFNPSEVGSYRLIGYENRMLAKEDFNDDKKDAGEIGAGHTVTALYELVPPGKHDVERAVDPLKYQQPVSHSSAAGSGELLTLRLRYKEPDGTTSRLLSFPVRDDGRSLQAASADFKLASSVALFGMLLRESEHRGNGSFDDVQRLALDGGSRDRHGHRAEFARLVELAASLSAGR